MSAAVRPIYVLGAAAMDTLRQRAQVALDAWAREWVSGYENDAQAAAPVHARSASDSARLDGHERYDAVRTETGCMWFSRAAATRLTFDTAVAGGSHTDEWIAAIADSAWEARNHALCSALLGTPINGASIASPSVSLLAFGSGAVELSCEALGLHAIADSGVWRSVPPTERATARPLPKPTPLDRAAQRATVSLDIMLGSVDVELPKLLDLRCGDVLRLPQRLDQGVTVLCAGNRLARAVLGETQGRKCVQLLADDQSQT